MYEMDSLDTTEMLNKKNKDTEPKPAAISDEIEGLGVGIADEKIPADIASAESAYGVSNMNASTSSPSPSDYYSSMPQPTMTNNNLGNTAQSPYGNYGNSMQQPGYSSPMPSSVEQPKNMSDYMEENNILGRITKINKNISNAEMFLIIMGVMITIGCVILSLVSSSVSELAGYGTAFVAMSAIEPLIYIPLAYGIEKKKAGCAIAAIVIEGLGLLLLLLTIVIGGGSNIFAIVIIVSILMSFIAALKSINEFHQLEAQYSYHPNYNISRLFEKQQFKMKAKYVIMIITMALSIIVFVGSIVKGVVGVADSVSGVISSSSSDYSTWESVNIGEKNVSVKFPTSPEIDNDGYYYAQGIDNYVSVEYGEDYLEGYSGKQIESILVESIGDERYNDRGYKLESEALKKNDFCTYYEKIYYNEEDNDTVAVWCMAVEDDVTYIDYQVYGKYDEIEDKIDAYFATVKRVY